MSTIHNISATFILAFKWIQSDSKMTTESMFKSLSLMMGGDGETIKKKQLDKYIADAENGKISTDEKGIQALKTMQQNWYRITDGKDTINVADANAFSALLAMAFSGGFTSTPTPDASTSKIETQDEISSTKTTDFADDSDSINKNTTVKDLTSKLKTLLGGTTDENDDSNANLIATLTNLIAASAHASTVSVEA